MSTLAFILIGIAIVAIIVVVCMWFVARNNRKYIEPALNAGKTAETAASGVKAAAEKLEEEVKHKLKGN